MKKPLLVSLIAVSSLTGTLAQAESLLQIYKLAQANDPTLRAAAASYTAEKEEVIITKGNLYPALTFNGNLGYSTSTPPTGDVDVLSNALSINMNYPIYSPALGYAVEAVELNFARASVAYENAEEDLALKTLTEYFQLLQTQASLKTVQSQVRSTASQLDRVKKQFDVGLVPITDMQDAQAAYDAIRVTELTAQSSVTKAQQALLQRTGKLIKQIPELATDYPISLNPTDSAEAFFKIANQNNNDIRTLDYQLRSAETNISIQKSNGRSPTVVLTGSISRSDADYSPTNQNDGVTTNASIGVGVSIPLYKGGAIDASVRKASATSESVREQKAAALQSLELGIRSLYLDLETTVAQVKAQQQLMRSRSSALEATQAGYDVGTRNLVELLDAQSRLFDAQNNYQQLRYSFIIQKLNLLEMTGQLSEAEIIELDKWLKG